MINPNCGWRLRCGWYSCGWCRGGCWHPDLTAVQIVDAGGGTVVLATHQVTPAVAVLVTITLPQTTGVLGSVHKVQQLFATKIVLAMTSVRVRHVKRIGFTLWTLPSQYSSSGHLSWDCKVVSEDAHSLMMES